METTSSPFKKYLLVCQKWRDDGSACCQPEGEKICSTLKEIVKSRDLKKHVRVTHSGCQDMCQQGPNVLLMPDNIWFKNVSASDAEAIVNHVAELLP